MVVSFDKYGEQLKRKASSLDEPVRQFYRRLILVAWNIGRNGIAHNRFLQSLLPRFELDIVKFREERVEPLEAFAGTVSVGILAAIRSVEDPAPKIEEFQETEIGKALKRPWLASSPESKTQIATRRILNGIRQLTNAVLEDGFESKNTRLALKQLDSSTRNLSQECDGIEEITCGIARGLLIGFRKEIAAIEEMRARTRQEFVDSTAGRHAAPAAASAGPPILAAAAAPEDGIATVDPAASPTLTSTCAAERPDAAAAAAAATRQQSVPPFAEPSFECGDCSALHASEGELASHRLRHCCDDIAHVFVTPTQNAEPAADDVGDVNSSTSSEANGNPSILATLLNQPSLTLLNAPSPIHDCPVCRVQFASSHELGVHNALTHNSGSRDRAQSRSATRQRLNVVSPATVAPTAAEQIPDDPATFAAAAAAFNAEFQRLLAGTTDTDAADAASAAVTAEEDIVDAPVDAAAAELAERTCPECGNLFKNDRGVSMHMSKMHKEAAAARRTERAKSPRDRSRSRSRGPSVVQSRAPSRAPSAAPARSRASSIISRPAAPPTPAATPAANDTDTPRARRRTAAQQREASTAGQAIDDDDEDYTPVLFDQAASRAYRTAAISAYQQRELREREANLAAAAATATVDDVITIDDDDDELLHSEANPAPEPAEEATVAPSQSAPEPSAPETREDARGRRPLTPEQAERLARISAAKRAASAPPKPPSAAVAPEVNSHEAIAATIERVLAPVKAPPAAARQSRAQTVSRAATTTPAPKTPMTAFDAALRGIERLYVPAAASRPVTPAAQSRAATPVTSRSTAASRAATPARYQSFASASISRAPTPAPTTSAAQSRATTPAPHRSTGAASTSRANTPAPTHRITTSVADRPTTPAPTKAAQSRATTPVPHHSTGAASRSTTPAPITHRVASDRAKTMPPVPGAASRPTTPAPTTAAQSRYTTTRARTSRVGVTPSRDSAGTASPVAPAVQSGAYDPVLPTQCTECGKPFTTERGLNIHIGQQHKEMAAKRKAEQRAASCAPSAKKSRAGRAATTAPSAPIDAAPINMSPSRWKHALPPVLPARKSGGSLMSKARNQASETSRRYSSVVKRN